MLLKLVNMTTGSQKKLQMPFLAHEVKARKAGSMVSPTEAVNLQKERHLRFAATQYMRNCDGKYRTLQPRFDVVCVTIGKRGFKVTEHIKGAF